MTQWYDLGNFHCLLSARLTSDFPRAHQQSERLDCENYYQLSLLIGDQHFWNYFLSLNNLLPIVNVFVLNFLFYPEGIYNFDLRVWERVKYIKEKKIRRCFKNGFYIDFTGTSYFMFYLVSRTLGTNLVNQNCQNRNIYGTLMNVMDNTH